MFGNLACLNIHLSKNRFAAEGGLRYNHLYSNLKEPFQSRIGNTFKYSSTSLNIYSLNFAVKAYLIPQVLYIKVGAGVSRIQHPSSEIEMLVDGNYDYPSGRIGPVDTAYYYHRQMVDLSNGGGFILGSGYIIKLKPRLDLFIDIDYYFLRTNATLTTTTDDGESSTSLTTSVEVNKQDRKLHYTNNNISLGLRYKLN